MDDIVQRLRNAPWEGCANDVQIINLTSDAAAEIERLRAQVAELEYTIVYAPQDRMSDPADKDAYLAARGVVQGNEPAEKIIARLRGR